MHDKTCSHTYSGWGCYETQSFQTRCYCISKHFEVRDTCPIQLHEDTTRSKFNRSGLNTCLLTSESDEPTLIRPEFSLCSCQHGSLSTTRRGVRRSMGEGAKRLGGERSPRVSYVYFLVEAEEMSKSRHENLATVAQTKTVSVPSTRPH